MFIFKKAFLEHFLTLTIPSGSKKNASRQKCIGRRNDISSVTERFHSPDTLKLYYNFTDDLTNRTISPLSPQMGDQWLE